MLRRARNLLLFVGLVLSEELRATASEGAPADADLALADLEQDEPYVVTVEVDDPAIPGAVDLWPDDLVVIPSAARVAYVLGQVHRPGAVDVPPNARMTVSMAVANGGSYTKFAATGRVQLLRHDPSGNVSRIAVDLDAILGGRIDLDLNLEPGDVVWVPERGLF